MTTSSVARRGRTTAELPAGGLAGYIRPEDRVIEVAPPHRAVAAHLAEQGRRRYLALIDEDAAATGQGEWPGPTLPRRSVDLRQVGSDVLILHGAAVRSLWIPRDLPVRLLVVPSGSVEARIAAAVQRRIGNLRTLGTAAVGGETYTVHEVADREVPPLHSRIYLSPVVGHRGLLSRLDEEGLKAVVLRWSEALPDGVPAGDDLDLLATDDEVEKVRAVVAEQPGTLPVDLYSVSGLPGSDRDEIPCYPPHLAARIIAGAVRHASGAWIPGPDDHLRSFAYHIAYHKGGIAGIPSRLVDTVPAAAAAHDYAAELTRLAGLAGTDIPATLEGIDEHLAAAGWRPPRDTLRRMWQDNEWIRARFFDESLHPAELPEVSVFLLRRRAAEVLSSAEVEDALERSGFAILRHRELDAAARQRAELELRGGNWGPDSITNSSGGPPVEVLVTLHHSPRLPDVETRSQYPNLSNAEILAVKQHLRGVVDGRLGPERAFNPVHSSDNEEEAWEYVATALPDAVAELRAEVDRHRDGYRTSPPPTEVLRLDPASKTELLHTAAGPAVRKTVALSGVAGLEQEIRHHLALEDVPGVPPLLASGPNWVERPYHADRLGYRPGEPQLVPLGVLRSMVDTLHALHRAGYALVGATPADFVRDGAGDLWIADLGRAHRYRAALPDFSDSFTWDGHPGGAPGASYTQRWLPWTGLPRADLCSAPPWRQHLLRARYRARRGAAASAAAAAALPRRAVARLRSSLGWRYRAWARSRTFT